MRSAMTRTGQASLLASSRRLASPSLIASYSLARGTGPVDHALKDLLHLGAAREQRVAAVLHLVDRVGVVEACPFLLLNIQGEAQAGRIDPPLAHLVQPLYGPLVGQGVCNASQARGVGDLCEAIALLTEVEAGLGRSAGNVLVAVEDDLGTERGMTRHFDRDMPPFGVPDVEGVVIHERRLLAQQWAARARTSDVPHRCNRPRHKNKEESSLDNVRGQVLLTDLVLVLSPAAVYDWDLVSFGKTAYTATKATGHAHQMGVVQLVVRPHQPTPPVPKTASRVAQRVVSVQDDPIDTVITPL